ncbi:MAG: hypothetical protein R3230_06770, partial [Nitrosopumilaceae archaeon]|nr:hypothetical protein [Nitrosopumilaceae archaeon]
MQEIALFLTGIAGAASAAAYRKFPRNKSQLVSMGTSSNIQNKIHSLKIEKDILTKTISRLYQHDAGLSKIQKDRLLSKYQHQLGIVLAKIEKLEEASKHPDLGPIGDGLVTLMDQKLSALDQRLYELSSKIAVASVQTPEIKKEKVKKEVKEEIKKPEVKIEEEKPKEEELPKPIDFTKFDFPEKPRHPVELTTLTSISSRPLEFPLIEQRKVEPKNEIVKEILKPQEKQEEKIDAAQSSITTFTKTEEPPKAITKQEQELPTQLPKPELITDSQLNKPKPSVKSPEDDSDDEDDTDDLDRIKGEIMKTLSKLEQAEV